MLVLEKINRFCKSFTTKYNKAMRKDRLLKDPWIQGHVEVEVHVDKREVPKVAERKKVGPAKEFGDSAPRSKPRKIQRLRQSYSKNQIRGSMVKKLNLKKSTTKLLESAITSPELKLNQKLSSDVVWVQPVTMEDGRSTIVLR